MENIKQLLKKINKENPSENDIKMISLRDYYVGLKKDGKIDEWKRLRLLHHLYPEMVYKNNFRSIRDAVHEPIGKLMALRDKHTFTKYEEYTLKKFYHGEIPNYSYVTFCISDLYDYFGLKY